MKMEDFIIQIIEKEIKRLNRTMKSLESMNVIDSYSITQKKDMQKRINKGYGALIDIKMDLENLLKKIG